MRREIKTDKAPAAIGPYVQAVVIGNMVLISGQIPLDAETGLIADDISAQTTQSLKNVKAVAEAAGLQLSHIVKTTVFIKDMNEFDSINTAYSAFFSEHQARYPARSCVEVARLPKDVKIEIEAIAFSG